MNPEGVILVMFSSIIVLMLTGTPMALGLGFISIVSSIFVWGPDALPMIALRAVASCNYVFLAIPFFIFTGAVVEKAGFGDDAYRAVYNWLGFLKGGLAAATVFICTVFAAMTGVSSAATVAMGLVALPPMLKLKYDKEISMGCIQAGGALGILIPPSLTFVIIGVVGELSVGKLFAGGVFCGLLLSGLFVVYILVRCFFQPRLGPAAPLMERKPLKERVTLLKGMIPLFAIIVVILGPIFGGVSTITEAAALGGIGSIVLAALLKRLNWKLLIEATERTFVLSCMIVWIIIGASAFAGIFAGSGVHQFFSELISGAELNRWVVVIIMMVILLILGCFVETTAIIMITLPLFLPIIKNLGFDPIWFGVIFVMDMEMGFLTPPFGYNLFYMKGVVESLQSSVPEARDITIIDIYKSVWPFVILQGIGLAIVMKYPQIVLWLPNLIFGIGGR